MKITLFTANFEALGVFEWLKVYQNVSLSIPLYFHSFENLDLVLPPLIGILSLHSNVVSVYLLSIFLEA